MPSSLSASDLSSYARCIWQLRIDNLGFMGTQLLFDAIRLEELPPGFQERVTAKYPQNFGSWAAIQESPSHFQIFSYAEYTIFPWSPSGHHSKPLVGTLLRENGLRSPDSGRPRWLHAVTLPINAFVDRELCAEFQLLEAISELLAATCSGFSGCIDEQSRAKLIGSVYVLISSTSCLSCVGAVRQFQLLWPSLHFAVGMGRRAGTLSA